MRPSLNEILITEKADGTQLRWSVILGETNHAYTFTKIKLMAQPWKSQ